MRVLVALAVLFCATTAEAQYRYGWNNYGRAYSGPSFYTYNAPNWGYTASPYGMTTYNRVGRFTFFQSEIYETPAYQPFVPYTAPVVVPGYGYGGYGHARHLGF